MSESIESALRQFIRVVAQDVAAQMLCDRQFPKTPPALRPLPTDNCLLLQSHEAAKRLSISTRTLNKLACSGSLPCVRIGRSVRYSVDALKKWIRETESTAKPRPESTTDITQPRSIKPKSPAVLRTSARNQKRTAKTKQKALKEKGQETSKPNLPAKRQRVEEERRRFPFDALLGQVGVDRRRWGAEGFTDR
jgi:excisionase family DNA binding protein